VSKSEKYLDGSPARQCLDCSATTPLLHSYARSSVTLSHEPSARPRFRSQHGSPKLRSPYIRAVRALPATRLRAGCISPHSSPDDSDLEPPDRNSRLKHQAQVLRIHLAECLPDTHEIVETPGRTCYSKRRLRRHVTRYSCVGLRGVAPNLRNPPLADSLRHRRSSPPQPQCTA